MNELQAETAEDFENARDALAGAIAEFNARVRSDVRSLNARMQH
jgi:hypothetical protein